MAPLNDQIFALLANSGGNSNATNQLYATTAYGDKQRQMIAQEDPYSGLAQLGNIGTSAVFNAPGLSLRDRILGAALSGLVGGVGQGLSQNYQGRAQQAYNDAVLASLEGRTIEQPGELNASIFADAQNQANIFKLKQATAEQEANRSLKAELVKDIFANNLKTEAEKEAAILKAKVEKPWLADAIDQVSGNQPKSIASSERGALDLKDSSLYVSPEDRVKAEQQKEKDLIANTDSLRKEIFGRPEFDKFGEVSTRLNTLKKAISDPSAISDLDFVYGVAKVLDPNSVVRESEAGMVIDSQSIPNSVLGRLNTALQGGSAQNPIARVDLLRLVGRNYDELKAQTDAIKNQYLQIAKERGIPEANILPPEQSRSVIPAEPAAKTAFLADLAKRFPQTPEGRAAFKDAVTLLER